MLYNCLVSFKPKKGCIATNILYTLHLTKLKKGSWLLHMNLNRTQLNNCYNSNWTQWWRFPR